MTLVYMFPGQNSRYPEMIERVRQWSGCDRILQQASDVLGRDVPRVFSHNRDVQVGVFLASYIRSEWLAAEGIRPDASIGLSLGEYNHLVSSGALSFPTALRLLDARGTAYEKGPRGLMMSVFPVAREQVVQALGTHADISIELSSNHFVIGGETAAVQAAAARLEEEAFVQPRVVDAAFPMHSQFFQPAADIFREALEKSECSADLVEHLYRHVFNTLHWAHSLAGLVSRHPDAVLVEVGPGRVLYNLASREYKQLQCFCSDDPESMRRLQEVYHAA